MQNEELEPPISQAVDELERTLVEAATTFKDRCQVVGDERWRPMLSWAVSRMLDNVYDFPSRSSWQPDQGDLDAATVNGVVGAAMGGMIAELRGLRDRGVAVDKNEVLKRITEMAWDI
jgi:hypothetical protein